MIENSHINHKAIQNIINGVCGKGADVIVLGCTHYHWIKDFITDATKGRAQVIEPSEAISRRVATLLELR